MLKIDDAIDQIIAGAQEANRRYLQIAGGATVHEYGVEPFISARIAETLHESSVKRGELCFATLETTFWELVDWSLRGDAIGERYVENDGQRADIAYWNRHNLPEGVIEVKREFSFSNCESDIRKITALISRLTNHGRSTLKWGAVVATREKTEKSMKDKKEVLTAFLEKCEERFPDFTFKGRCSEVDVEPGSLVTVRRPELVAFQAYAVLFRRKKE